MLNSFLVLLRNTLCFITQETAGPNTIECKTANRESEFYIPNNMFTFGRCIKQWRNE